MTVAPLASATVSCRGYCHVFCCVFFPLHDDVDDVDTPHDDVDTPHDDVDTPHDNSRDTPHVGSPGPRLHYRLLTLCPAAY